MKILVFSDIHGKRQGAQLAVQIAQREKAQKVVFCGDIFGGWNNDEQLIAGLLKSIDGVLYFVRGNNDRYSYNALLDFEDNALMYHFGRTLFFTHGDRYNGWRVPPVLKENDALIFGHTHCGSLQKHGVFALNVGSLCYPRSGPACYLVLDESGATLKHTDGTDIYHLGWE